MKEEDKVANKVTEDYSVNMVLLIVTGENIVSVWYSL